MTHHKSKYTTDLHISWGSLTGTVVMSRSMVASIWVWMAWWNPSKSLFNESHELWMSTTQMWYLKNVIAILRPLNQTIHKLLQSLSSKHKHLHVERSSAISWYEKLMREINEKYYELLNLQACVMHLKHHAEQSQESDELQAGAWWQNLKHCIQ